jgi:proteasome alpha subunit
MGGNAEPIANVLKDEHDGAAGLDAAVQLAVKALRATTEGAESRDIHADGLEAAVLDRTRPRRAFKRLSTDRLTTILGA